MADKLKMAGSMLLWIPAYALNTIAWIMGIFVVGILVALNKTEMRYAELSQDMKILMLKPSWAKLWANHEDHVDGPARPTTHPSTLRWLEWAEDKSHWVRAMAWSVLRNSVSGSRVMFDPIEQHETRFSSVWPAVERPSPDVRFYGNSLHVNEDWKRGAMSPGELKERWVWHLARKGWRCGLWVRRARNPRRYHMGYHEIRIGWGIIPLPARNNERYAKLKLQYHGRGEGNIGFDEDGTV